MFNQNKDENPVDIAFVMGGRTGGPLLPSIAIANGISFYKSTIPVIIGVNNSFEQRYAKNTNLPFEILPEAKLTLLSFTDLSWFEIFKEICFTFWMVVKLLFSYAMSIGMLLKYKPKVIITSGSFLAVPMVFAAKTLGIMMLCKTKVIVHQQDVIPSLSNKLILKLADSVSYVFDQTFETLTKGKFRVSKNVTPIKIYNPIDFTRFYEESLDKVRLDSILENFLFPKKSEIPTLPLLLVFGGGSGAKAINEWVYSNINTLLKTFKVLHLTGALQNVENPINNKSLSGYLSYEMFSNEMPVALIQAHLVIARAGLATITELQYLAKPAFLVPIPSSHQVENAHAVSELFPTLDQNNQKEWISQINDLFPEYFRILNNENRYTDKSAIISCLDDYYLKLINIVYNS
jgi:UDP-N-acetylglucosamine--N-acetylmuramyl-(pentapeptide) pyrophosphoryl-undecaprenol N-acetylglucosamine transferase